MSLVGLGRAIEQVRIGALGQVTNRWSPAFNSKERSFAELIQTSPNETSGPLVGNLARTYAGSRGRPPDIRACWWMRDTSEVSAWIESDFRTKRMPFNHGAGHMPVLGFGTLTSLLPQSCGTPIVGPSASNRLSRRVWTDSGSTIWISLSQGRQPGFHSTR